MNLLPWWLYPAGGYQPGQPSPRYRAYMRSRAWWRRCDRYDRWRFRWTRRHCERCGVSRGTALTHHHRTYARLYHERKTDLVLLCWPCHRQADAGRRSG